MSSCESVDRCINTRGQLHIPAIGRFAEVADQGGEVIAVDRAGVEEIALVPSRY
jgi:hypothetical protein